MRRLAPSRRVMISDYGRLNITGQGHTGVQASLANKSFLFGHLLCSFQYDPIDGKNSTEPQKNTQKHVFLGLTKNTEKHFYHLGI
tara:strand:- start:202 stop:456 length:255 start_codon:yes stop_codon:yes gene_type:complete